MIEAIAQVITNDQEIATCTLDAPLADVSQMPDIAQIEVLRQTIEVPKLVMKPEDQREYDNTILNFDIFTQRLIRAARVKRPGLSR